MLAWSVVDHGSTPQSQKTIKFVFGVNNQSLENSRTVYVYNIFMQRKVTENPTELVNPSTFSQFGYFLTSSDV